MLPLLGGKPKFNFGHGVPAMQENLVVSKNPDAVVNDNFQYILKSGTDPITKLVIYESPISHFLAR
jgi:hypothetical protein